MTNQENVPAGWYDDGTGRQRWYDGTEWGQYAEEVQVPPLPAVDNTDPVIVRRTRRAPFMPPQPSQDSNTAGAIVSRNWGIGLRSANAKKDSGLTRNRKIAGDLPEWSPLPPGELSVDRTAGRHS